MILFIADKNKYTTKRLIEEAKKAGLLMEVVDTADLAKRKFKVDVKKYSALFVRFFDRANQKQIVSLARKFKRAGKKIIGNVLDNNLGKSKSYEALKKAGLSIPKTYPFSQSRTLALPMVIKSNHGLGAKEVFFVKQREELKPIQKKFKATDLLAQEFIFADFEYKVITVGYKSLPFILKLPVNKKFFRPDFERWQVKKMLKLSPLDKRAVKLGEQASKVLKRELSKVDILSAGNKLYILEVNRWPGLGVPEKYSGYNIAGAFIKLLREGQK